MAQRQIEVFTAGCPLCEPAVQQVKELACPNCDLTVHDLSQPDAGEAAKRAAGYGVRVIPAVVVNGSLVSCCESSGPNRDELIQAGIGQPL